VAVFNDPFCLLLSKSNVTLIDVHVTYQVHDYSMNASAVQHSSNPESYHSHYQLIMSLQANTNGVNKQERDPDVEIVDHDDFNVGKLMQELNGAESMLNSIESRAAMLDAKLDALLQEASTAANQPEPEK
jgi:hypothetical protein